MSNDTKYDLAREQIKHEDGLVNNRITWFLVFNGLLFGTVFQALSLFQIDKFPKLYHPLLVIALCLLCVVGAMSSYIAASAVKAAHNQIQVIKNWYMEKNSDGNLPFVMGTQGIKILGIPFAGSSFLYFLSLVWLALLALLVYGSFLLRPC